MMEQQWISERFDLAFQRLQLMEQQLLSASVTLTDLTDLPDLPDITDLTKRRNIGLMHLLSQQTKRFLLAGTVLQQVQAETYFHQAPSVLAQDNQVFYQPFQELGYDTSFANPDYCQSVLPRKEAQFFSFLTREFSCIFHFAVTGQTERLVRYMELYLEIWSFLEAEAFDLQPMQQMYIAFIQDYAQKEVIERCRLLLAQKENLSSWDDIQQDPVWLYRFGLPLDETKRQNVLSLAQHTEQKRYEESLCLLTGLKSSRVGLNGPIHKLPFLIKDLWLLSEKASEESSIPNIVMYTAPLTVVEQLIGGGGLYGPMDKRFLRQRQKDAAGVFHGTRIKEKLLRQITDCENQYGCTVESVDLLKL